MSRSGWRIPIPSNLEDIQGDQVFGEMRKIGPIADPASYRLALLIGIIDIGMLSNIPHELILPEDRIPEEPHLNSLLLTLVQEGSSVLDHQSYQHFAYIPSLLEKAAKFLVDNALARLGQTEISPYLFRDYGIVFGYAEPGTPFDQQCHFIVTERREHFFNLYRRRDTPIVKSLCCGCQYYEGEQNQLQCPHHSQQDLRNATVELKRVECECRAEEYWLSGLNRYGVSWEERMDLCNEESKQATTCETCGNVTEEQNLHRCKTKTECFFCLAGSVLKHPNNQCCSECLLPLRVIYKDFFRDERLGFPCEDCGTVQLAVNFLYRARCPRHIVCIQCASKNLSSSGGLSSCRQCEKQRPAPLTSLCSQCRKNLASPELHAENGSDCWLCWDCAPSKWTGGMTCKLCRKHWSDTFTEVMLWRDKLFCEKCGFWEFAFRCVDCNTISCAFCRVRDAAQTTCQKCIYYVKHLTNNVRLAGCVFCFSLNSEMIDAGCELHKGHMKCLTRYGVCTKCPSTPLG